MKVEELERLIEEASGLTVGELRRTTGFVWFPPFDLSGKPTLPVTVVVGQPFPLKDGAIVYAMFQDNEVVRVYTLSKNAEKPSPPSCYTLTKTAPTYAAEYMTLETFIDEIAEEWQIVAGLDELDDEPDDEVDEKQAEAVGASAAASTPATLTP